MSSQKTEAPTSKRVLDARKKGQVGRSRELSTAAALLAGAVIVSAGLTPLVERLTTLGVALWSEPMIEPTVALELASEATLPLTLVLVALVALLVALIIFVQFKPAFYLQIVLVRWERIHPLDGLKKNFFHFGRSTKLPRTSS